MRGVIEPDQYGEIVRALDETTSPTPAVLHACLRTAVAVVRYRRRVR